MTTTKILKKQLAEEITEALDITIERGGDIQSERALKIIRSERNRIAGNEGKLFKDICKVLDRISTKISAGC